MFRGINLGASELLIADCRYAIRLPVPDTRPKKVSTTKVSKIVLNCIETCQ